MRIRRPVIAAFLLLIPLALWFGPWEAPSGFTRIDLSVEGGRVLFSGVLPDGERLTLRWRNSQFGLDVTERFYTKAGSLIQDQVSFASPNGDPPPLVSPADVDDLFHTGGAFEARGLSRPFTRIVYRIGEIGRPKMEVGGQTLSFASEAGFGGRVMLSAGRPAVREVIRALLFPR